eukprot:731436-Prymnesium_polylepis.2
MPEIESETRQKKARLSSVFRHHCRSPGSPKEPIARKAERHRQWHEPFELRRSRHGATYS